MEGGVMDGGGEEEQQRKTALRMLRRSPAKEVCNWSATPEMVMKSCWSRWYSSPYCSLLSFLDACTACTTTLWTSSEEDEHALKLLKDSKSWLEVVSESLFNK